MLSQPTTPTESVAPSPRAILIADDSSEVQETLRAWLGEVGYRVMCVGSGMEASRLVRARTFDVIITEIILPNGDGLELISAVKRFQPAARVIAYSGGGRYLSIDDCLRVARGFGAFAGLAKPAPRAQFLELVARAMAGAPNAAAS